MGNSSSDLLEELLFHCYQIGILDEVRREAKLIMKGNPSIPKLEAYESAFDSVRSNTIR
jgi:hypothetical protein